MDKHLSGARLGVAGHDVSRNSGDHLRLVLPVPSARSYSLPYLLPFIQAQQKGPTLTGCHLSESSATAAVS